MAYDEFSKTLCFSYGKGVYARDGRSYEGDIILTSYKLYLKNGNGEISTTFIPLEKIYKVRVFWGEMTIFVRPSNFMQFEAKLIGNVRKIWALAHDLGEQRQLRKKKFGLEWDDPDFFRVL